MKNIITLLFLLFFTTLYAKDGHKIQITISGLADSSIIVGHYYGKDIFIDDTLLLNKNATAIFEGDKKLTQGLYVVYLPNREYFDFIVGSDQVFSIKNDTVGFVENMEITGSDENQYFLSFKEFMEQKSLLLQQNVAEKKNTSDPAQITEIDNKIEQLTSEVHQYRQELIEKNKETFLSLFIRSTLDVKIPETEHTRDRKYRYYRTHYFDNFDLEDNRLLNSPVFIQRMMIYLDRLVLQQADSLIPQVDMIIEKCRSKPDVFRYVLGHLHNYYNSSNVMGLENVFVHLTEKYYLTGQAEWVSDEFLEKLKNHITKIKHVLIGNTAYELKMMTLPKDSASISMIQNKLEVTRAMGHEILKDESSTDDTKINEFVKIFDKYVENTEEYTSLHQIEAPVTLLWFWEPSCSHCREATPKLKPIFDKYHKKGLEIYCIYIEGAKFMSPDYFFKKPKENWNKYIDHVKQWMSFITTHDLEAITHVWDPYNSTHFRDYYNIESSPILYLLDDEKRIVAKRLSLRQIDEILENIFSE